MKIIPVLILSMFLSGCSILDYFVKKPPEPPPPVTQIVAIDSSLLMYCSLLDEKSVNTFQESLEAYASLATKYGDCALRQASGVKLIKKLGNIEDARK